MARTDKPASTPQRAAKEAAATTPSARRSAGHQPAVKKPAAKKPAVKKPAAKKAARRPSAAARERAREHEREQTRIARAETLLSLGLHPGDPVRFRRVDETRWKNATVERVENDGSIGLRDGKGAARAIPAELVEVKATGPRGGVVWEPLPDRIAAAEQLRLI